MRIRTHMDLQGDRERTEEEERDTQREGGTADVEKYKGSSGGDFHTEMQALNAARAPVCLGQMSFRTRWKGGEEKDSGMS